MATFTKSNLLIIAAFAAIYIIWGSTYLAAAFAIDELPAFIMIGTRYASAGIILWIGIHLFGQYQSISKEQFLNSLLSGFMMIGLGGGLIFYTVQYLDTGLIALITAGQPLLILLMMWGLQAKKPAKQAYWGILLGIIGMYLLVSQKVLIASPNQWKGVLCVFGSMLSWGYGTILVSERDMPKPHTSNSAIQMIFGGSCLIIFSFLVEDPLAINLGELQMTTWLAMIYLVFLGSIVAFSAFNFLLTKVSPEKVATSTYVNPIVAMFLGWWLRDELITLQSVFAAGIMLAGVFFINVKQAYFKQLMQKVNLVSRK